jgi:6-phosphogluconolactonase
VNPEPHDSSGGQQSLENELSYPGVDSLTLHEANDAAEIAEAASGFIAGRLREAIERRGRAVFAVSGGRSPEALLTRLCRCDLDWSRVIVVLVDERAVGARHPLSNTAAIRRWLLNDLAQRTDFRCFVPDTDEMHLSAEALTERASAVFPAGATIDVALLGLGLDGHFASIFPGVDQFDSLVATDNLEVYAPVRLPNPPPEAPVDRVTLTLARLLDARCLVLPLAGPQKRAALERGRRAPDPAWPISFLLRQYRNALHIWLTRS